MSQKTNSEIEVHVRETGADGLQQVSVVCNGRELAERVKLDDAYQRVCFAARAIRQVGLDVTRERLAELELRLARTGRAASEDRPVRRFSQRKIEQVRWLWPGRIARGAITLLAGDPGLGKSLVALDIAARVSRGMDWPDGARGLGEPGSVVYLSGEDNLETTILPRLEAMGADLNQLATVEPERPDWSGGAPSAFELDRDLAELRRTVRQLGDCRLIVFDPISAFLGQAGECSNAVVRRLLAPLTELAQRENLAVLFVVHLRKDMGAVVRRALGSMAFMAVSRAAWLVLRDPTRPERRLMLPVKNNLADDADGLAYELVEAMDESPSGELLADDLWGSGVAVVKWSAERLRMRAEEVISESRRGVGRPDSERRQAIAWLQEFLSNGPRGAMEVREQAAAQGLAFTTLRRAFRELQVVARKDQSTRHGAWTWALPEAKVAGCHVEERSGGVVEELGKPPERETKPAGAADDVGSDAMRDVGSDAMRDVGSDALRDVGSDVFDLVRQLSPEDVEAEAQLLAAIEATKTEAAKFGAQLEARMRANEIPMPSRFNGPRQGV